MEACMDNINNINKTRILSPFFSKGAPDAGFVNVYVGWTDMGEQPSTFGGTPVSHPINKQRSN